MKKILKTRSPFFAQYESLPPELASTNLFPDSDDPSAISRVNADITQNVLMSPDGELNGWKVARTNVTGYVSTANIPRAASVVQRVGSAYVKKGTSNYVSMRVQCAYPTRADIQFDFETESVVWVNNFGSSAQVLSYGSEYISNGWYRIYLGIQTDASTQTTIKLSPKDDPNEGIDSGDSSTDNYVFTWGWQLEEGVYPSSYIETSGSTVARAVTTDYTEETVTAEVRVWEGSGGYDYDRTNLQVYSQELDNAAWTKSNAEITNSVLSPLGDYTANRYRNTSTSNSYVYDIVSVSTSTKYTLSIYAKGDTSNDILIDVWDSVGGTQGQVRYDLSTQTASSLIGSSSNIQSVGNDWYRISVTFTTDASLGTSYVRIWEMDNTILSSFFVWGVQLEEGVLTDYIATDSAIVTINAYDNDRPTDANYTITKNPTNGKTTFEISELIRDYIEQTDVQNSGSIWAEVKLYDNANPEAYIEQYFCTEGYVDATEGLQTYANVNGNTQFLVSNRDIFIPEGQTMDVPIYGDYDLVNGDFYLIYTGGVTSGGQYFSTLENNSDQINYITLSSDDDRIFLYEDSSNIDEITVKVPDCSKYDAHKLIFVNKFGAKQEMFFNMKTTERIRTTSDGFNRNVVDYENLTLSNGKHSYKKRINESTESYTLNTGFVSEDNVQAFEELILSEYVWLQKEGEDPKPVNVESSSMTRKTHLNDKLIQFEIEVKSNHSLISISR